MSTFEQVRGRLPIQTPIELADLNNNLNDDNHVTLNAPIGQQRAEAAALSWGQKTVWLISLWIWVCFFALSFQSSVLVYVMQDAYTASFRNAPAYATATVASNIVGAVIFLPLAKSMNVFGRTEGLLVMLVVYMVGLIIMATANHSDAFAVGYVIHYIGFDGVYNILQVFVADVSDLRNRALAFAFVQSPFLITAFAGPAAAQASLKGVSWKWAIGAFCIVQPAIILPLTVVFRWHCKKSEAEGRFVHYKDDRGVWEKVVHYFHEFDVVGALLLICGFLFLLLPFTLVQSGRLRGYDSAGFSGMIEAGVISFLCFYIWESQHAREPFIRWEFLKRRTVLGAVILATVVFISFYSWDSNFFVYIKVVHALDVKKAGLMGQIYNIGSCFFSLIIGLWIRYVNEFKYTTLFFSLPLMMLGAGLTIHFRGSESPIGLVVLAQLFIAFAGGALVIAEDMAVMAASDRQDVPFALALLWVFTRLGGAIGETISSAIAGRVFRHHLVSSLPTNDPSHGTDVVAWAQELFSKGYALQETFLPGTPVRTAINGAWAETMKYNAITATAFLVLAFPAVARWHQYPVKTRQNKGTTI